ncbi:MAG: HEAT repeat domain-containing protein [Acidobacteria bacterium]|nr:HEAT repeat domain-containing protein [Acidobacteriota bacterium]
MPIDWITIAAVVTPFLKAYIADRARQLAKQKLDDTFKAVTTKDTLTKLNEAFTLRFGKELDSVIDLPTLAAEPYREALEAFLQNHSVQDVLQAPLDGQSPVDWKLLRGTWDEFYLPGGERLITLPEDFDWAKVAKLYAKAVERLGVADPELRPVIQALATIRTAESAQRSAEANMRAADATERIAGPARAFDLPRYARAIKEAFAHLQLAPLTDDWTYYERDNAVRLETIYVPQSVKQALPPRDVTRDYFQLLKKEQRGHGIESDEEEVQQRKQEYAQLSTRPLMEVVDDPAQQRLVILGDPGLGKSTLLKHLALRWAEDPDGNSLALFIELRQAMREKREHIFLDYLQHGNRATCCLPRNEIDQHLKDNDSLVLFDGLDEVTEGDRSDAVAAIIRFAADYPQARIIVTTRIHGYSTGSTNPQKFSDAGFEQFTLQDFEEPEIDRFINVWYQAAFSNVADRERYQSRLQSALDESPAIRELAANPLLLTMMAILSRNQDLPRDRCDLYEKCAELLLKNWDLEKFEELKDDKQALDITDKLGPRQKMRILERVAAAAEDEETGLAGNLISEDKLKPIVEEELKQLGVDGAWWAADKLIRMLQERNFMLAYMGDRQYAFVHRTFLEYFRARDLKYRLEKTTDFKIADLRRVYRDGWPKDEWHEVLRLLSGLIGPEHAGACANELLEQHDAEDGHRAVILAAQCLLEVRELGLVHDVRAVARRRLIALTGFDLPYYYEPWSDEATQVARVRVGAVQELARGWKSDPDTIVRLKQRAAEDDFWQVRQAAVQELARGWKADPNTVIWLKQRTTRDDHWAVRQAAVQELARGFESDPETLALLKQRVTEDYQYPVRQAAIQELARGWKSDPDTVVLLKQRAAEDVSREVRWQALVDLVRGFKDDPDTVALLKQRGTQDDEYMVRHAAVQELARGWKSDPDTVVWLKRRAAEDQDMGIQQAAIEELAQGWKSDKTFVWLMKRAGKDNSGAVRQSALLQLAHYWKSAPETIVLLKQRAVHDHHYRVRWSAVRELARGWKSDPETIVLLKQCAASDDEWEVRQTAVQEVARGWKSEPDTLALLKQRAAEDRDYPVRQAAVGELARGWKSDPDTVVWLKQRAAEDIHEDVRYAAVRELARGWKSDPDTVALLKQHAAEDTDVDVRQAAVRELARGWKSDPDTVVLLQKRAAEDKSEYVRRAAIQELARGWKSDPDTVVWLKQRAAEDTHEDVRQAAVRELARGWKADPDTVVLLKQRAAEDTHEDVRQAAVQELARGWRSDPDVQQFLADLKKR